MEKTIQVSQVGSHTSREVILCIDEKKPTNLMQLRAVIKEGTIGRFVCGIDVCDDSTVMSTIGIWGRSFEDFVSNVYRFYSLVDEHLIRAKRLVIENDWIEDDYDEETGEATYVNKPLENAVFEKLCGIRKNSVELIDMDALAQLKAKLAATK